MSCAFGALISPNLAGFLADGFGFKIKCDIFATITMIFAIFYFFINVGLAELMNLHTDLDIEF